MALTTRLLDAAGVRESWDDLCVRTGASPFVRPSWLETWARAFTTSRLQVVAAYDGEQLRGVLPVVRGRAGVLTSPTNWHTPEFAPVTDSPEALESVVLGALRSTRAYLELAFLDEDDARRVVAIAAEHGHRNHSRELLRSPFLTIPDQSFEEFAQSRKKSKRRKITRVRASEARLAEAHGPVTVEVTSAADAAVLAGLLAVEDTGWKAEARTSIRRDPPAQAFYTAVVDALAAEGTLRLTLMRAGGTPVAGLLAVVSGGVHYALKIGYDEAFREFGPGQLLTMKSVMDAFDHDLDTYDFLGAEMRWKGDWTSTSRPLHRVHVFGNGPLGTGAAAWHEAVRPAVKRAVTRLRERRTRG